MRLVLFDIDGTLLSSEGMGRAAMQRALAEVFGSPGNPAYRYDGKTDKQIVRDVMRLEGHTDDHIDSRMEKMIDLYLDGLRSGAASGKFNVRPLDGVVEL
ncbi:MAG: HAD family hydrolase, partial [Gemmatimonadota bacterium]|nr:HAD family hydrolase [Gemmatimonadota bacterium]